MRAQDIISRKRDGASLTDEEIKFFVGGVTDGTFADYQSAALLMAIFLRGMDEAEQRALTEAMLRSGSSLDFSEIEKPKADKHSTGGVGDKTSLLIAPLAAACGVCVPMISGRGLGHTGGTLDKLESIPGYRVHLQADEARAILRRVGFVMMGQTQEIAPADRKLYALRDATATVEAIPLIVASIMSKKLAAGLGALVLDVKTGTGAFMHDDEHARQLAHALVATGNAFGVRTEALLTDMNQPLGRAVGHAVEVVECIEILRGEEDERARPVRDLSIELAARMVFLSNVETSIESARVRTLRALESGEGLECLRRNIEAQGGDARVCDEPRRLLTASPTREVAVESTRKGFVTRIDAAEIGFAIADVGGGRARVEDEVDKSVGFLADVKLCEEVRAGQRLGVLLCRENDSRAEDAAARIRRAYTIGDELPRADSFKLIKEVIAE
jgi:pyrimidine-nucleoside phosphorylase/thymidine phosphorylase